MKKQLILLLSIWLSCMSEAFAEGVVKVSGTACENYAANQSKTSIRVRVTDKASFNAVSQIPSLAKLKPQMLEHDFNVIVYNLVDNYVQNMAVKNVKNNENELCVEVTGSIPENDVTTVIADYSPTNPAPEYDFEKANGITEENNDSYIGDEPTHADVMYNGPEDFDNVPPPTKAPIAYEDEIEDFSADQPLNVAIISEPEAENTEPEAVDNTATATEDDLNALVYVAPVEFTNNTHSSTPIDVIKRLFSNDDLYTIVEYPDGADYTITSKVLKAKIDQINSQTRRLQMVVSAELKIKGADATMSDYQNRFVLFNSDENEQEVAMNLLRKLLFKSGKKLFARADQNERKRRGQDFLSPAK